jgi:hypothetical protein
MLYKFRNTATIALEQPLLLSINHFKRALPIEDKKDPGRKMFPPLKSVASRLESRK